ncbi:MAG: spore germination protein [Bacillaceae bacterium]|nr:spore germination protein [Bacillaceae bacterium]
MSLYPNPLVKINSNEGTIVTGGAFYIAPTNTSKVIAGSGAFNTGFHILNNNGFTPIHSVDPDVVDSIVRENV